MFKEADGGEGDYGGVFGAIEVGEDGEGDRGEGEEVEGGSELEGAEGERRVGEEVRWHGLFR